MSVAAASIGGRTAPWALAGFAAVLAASCAAELTGNPTWTTPAAALFALGLGAGWRHWLSHTSGRVAVFVAGGTAIAAAMLALHPADIAGAAARMSNVVVLMLCVSLLRPVFADRQLDAALASLLAGVAPALRPVAVLGAACATALGLSFGAVGVLGAALGGRAAPAPIAASSAMRGLVLSMLLGPSTASVAAVMAVYPGVSWAASLGIGVPLALIGGALGAILTRPLAMASSKLNRAKVSLALGLVLAELAATLVAHLLFGLSMTSAISLAAAVLALTCTIYWGRHDIGAAVERAEEQTRERWTLIMPEAALFLSCGLLIGLMQSPELAGVARAAVAAALPGGMWGIGVVLFAIPVIAVAGIHPMVPFALLAPMVTQSSLGISEAGLYAMWIVAFMLAMLLSPVSVLTMVTTTNFGVSGRLLGVRGNGLYAMALAAASVVAIGVLCAV
jgi:hypothetical protein